MQRAGSVCLAEYCQFPPKKALATTWLIFAHYENFANDNAIPGQVVLSVIDAGWSWQIPLKNALSVGVVIDKQRVAEYGSKPEQRLENIINGDSVLSRSGRNRKRVSRVMTYSNYQLMTDKGYGKGWVLLGDAYGFVDPMLSPGVFMALESAALLDRHVFTKPAEDIKDSDFDAYCNEMTRWHTSWANLIEFLYDGRLLSLFEAGQNVVKNSPKWAFARLVEWHMQRIIASMVSGLGTRSRYNQLALYHSCQHILGSKQKNTIYAINSGNTALPESPDPMVCFD